MRELKMVESKYLKFVLAPKQPKSGKTFVYHIQSLVHGDVLGEIKWYGGWRQYAFLPYPLTVWNPECLGDVSNVIDLLMEERRIGVTS